MNLLFDGAGVTHIALSRRNLTYLLKKLDQKTGRPVGLVRRVADDRAVFVYAEEDEDHYNSDKRDERSRGRMGVGPEDLE